MPARSSAYKASSGASTLTSGSLSAVNRSETPGAGSRDIPAQTLESSKLSKDLKARGFKFVGPTVCYAFMQATGMVNDHVTGCFRHSQIG